MIDADFGSQQITIRATELRAAGQRLALRQPLRFSELAQIAQAQGKTPDEVADEAVAMLVRKSQMEELMDFGNRHSAALGLSEADVDRLISENRAERRR